MKTLRTRLGVVSSNGKNVNLGLTRWINYKEMILKSLHRIGTERKVIQGLSQGKSWQLKRNMQVHMGVWNLDFFTCL